MGKFSITCTDWKVMRKNTLLGFATIRIAELRLSIHDVAVHQKGDARWAQPPSKPWLRDGALVTGDGGRPQYSPIFEFDGREVRDAFSAAVVEAVLAYAPNAFAAEPAS